MDYYYKFLFNVIPIDLIELFAALSGVYYLNKKKKNDKIIKYFVVFLWYTFINEIIGMYSPIAYFSNYKYFGIVKDTVFERNIWLYNIYFIINFSFLIYFFKSLLSNTKFRKTMNIVIIIFVLIATMYLYFSKEFFISYSILTLTTGSILVLINILMFYSRLLKADKVINLKKYLPIYLSIGVMFFYLCVTPIELFAKYFKMINEVYVNIRTNILLVANIFMYSTFITGFIVCAKSNTNKDELLN